MATAPHRPSASSSASTRVRRLRERLRHPTLAVLMLLAAGAAPTAYLSSAGRHASARLAPGDTVAVYGPHQFNGASGNGTTYVERFTVALVPGKQYLLRLDNGTTGGANRATSAVTTLNGYQVVSSSELTSGIASVTKVVSVRQVDTLRITVVGPAGSFVTATVSAAKTAEYAVSGPTDYGVPSGTSKTYTFSFNNPAAAGPPYRLYLTNGDSTGALRVTNASVTLNGTTVVTTTEFTKSVGSLTKTVTLTATNNVTIALKGSALTFATLTFTATDTAAPVLTITAPAAGAVTGTSPIAVSGTISDQSPTGVTVNGVAATVTNNTSYSASVPLTTQGSNTLTVIATDAGGRSTQLTRAVVFDNLPPALAVSAPVDGAATQAASVTVAATATDATALSVNTNGTPLTPGSGSSYGGSVALAAGVNVLTTTATDAAGNATSVVRTVTRDNTPPALSVTAPVDGTTTSADSITVSGSASDATALSIAANGIGLPLTGGAFSGKVALAPGPNTVTVVATDAAGNATTVARAVTREIPIPPDPSTVAPPLDPGAATSLASATAFLYAGSNPIQTGVAPGTIVSARAGVLRGKVLDRSGAPLSGARVEVLNHPELGQTVSRLDGMFDLAVNAGGSLVVQFSKSGFLPAQRQTQPAWGEYTLLDSLVLVPVDPQVTVIDFAAPIEVARGSVTTDVDGTRQPTLLFEQGTTASMTLPNGSSQPLTSISVRATEFTVGALGPASMPGTLPPASAYTYASELSVDEAMAAGATDVQFTKPVAFYLDNFLGFPAGTRVPLGTYDRKAGRWVPEPDGRVVKIIGITAGQADLDVSGSGSAASQAALDSLGISVAERERLATLYSVGKSLWRSRHSHFSFFDWNFGGSVRKAYYAIVDAFNGKLTQCSNNTGGSIIGCQDQSLGEEIAISGTPFSLHYLSARNPGYAVERHVTIPRLTMVDSALLTSARPLRRNEYPSHVAEIAVFLKVAGRIVDSRLLSPGGSIGPLVLTWDGKDAYGRPVYGRQPATVEIGYVYQMTYAISGGGGGGSIFGAPADVTTVIRRDADYITLSRIWKGEIGGLGIWNQQFGGWMLDELHAFDPGGKVLERGDGEIQKGESFLRGISTIAGQVPGANGIPIAGYTGDGGPATLAKLSQPLGLAVGPDGAVYLAARGNFAVRRIGVDGIITTVAGGTFGSAGDGGPATSAQLKSPVNVALGPDGSLYIADDADHRVRRVSPTGIISTFAGTGVAGSTGDGGPATAARLNTPEGLAVGPDGSIYVSEAVGHRVRRISPDGLISTFAGSGTCGGGPVGDGAQATTVLLCSPYGLAVGPDGSLYIAQPSTTPSPQTLRVRKVTPTGVISTIAGTGFQGLTGDEGPATAATFSGPIGLAVGPDGSVFVVDRVLERVRVIAPNGIITTAVGAFAFQGRGARGDGGLATQAYLNDPRGIAIGGDGSLYISQFSEHTVRKVQAAFPGFADLQVAVAAHDGSAVYQFDATGRHLRTVDPLTGKALLTFERDPAGRVTGVLDADGNHTTVERGPDGRPTAIVAPFGQRTVLTTDGAGYLASIKDPAGEIVRVWHSTGGLLDSLADPRGKVHKFGYDGLGRLLRDDSPVGGYQLLSRTEDDTTSVVTRATALGRATLYATDQRVAGGERRTITDPVGLVTTSTEFSDGSVTRRTPDGTVLTAVQQADPRWGLVAPTLKSLTVATPSGLTSTVTGSRRATLSDPTNRFSLITQLDSLVVNGNRFVTSYDAATRRATSTSPEQRQAITRVDSAGRVLSERTVGLDSVSYQYDARGRPAQVASGGRAWGYSYDALGRLLSTLDPLGRRDSLFYDTADRLTRRVLPGGREVRFAYDSSGNLTGVTPPSRPAHGFGYNAVDQATSYTPPNVGLTTPGTSYAYNLDRQLSLITRPDSVTIGFGYEPTTGRPSSVTFDRGQITFGYSPTTGQLTGLTAPGGNTLAYAYDGLLPTTVTWGGVVQGSVGVGYNADFRVTSQTVNGANSLTFGYDRDGLLTAAGALGLKRHAQHGLVERDSLDTVKSAWSYTSRGALAGYTATSGATTLFQTAYTRDSLDRIASLTETIGDTTIMSVFTYDSAGRLFEVRRDGVLTATYEYDLNGNRTRLTTPAGAVTGTYDDQDRLTSYGTTTYTYGSNGELKTKTEPGVGTTTYNYDALGNLTAVSLPDGTGLSYVIDGQNRRIGKKVNGALVQGFLYQDQLAPVAELDGNNQVVSRFVYGSRGNVPDYIVKSGVTYRLVTDHLGSVRLVVNVADGTVVQRMAYDEFGRVTQNSAPGFQPFGFAGGLLDSHTGLTRFSARDYDPTIGRWTVKDPIGFAGGDGNQYVYVGNDPLGYTDPTGLDWLSTLSNLSAGFGDAASFGLTAAFRRHFGYDDIVDRCSGAYGGGKVAGVTASVATGVAGSLNAGARTVFYSGSGALETALANKGAGMILAETAGGRLLNAIDKVVSVPQVVWKVASGIFAANATGEAQAFLRTPWAGSVWSTVERPIVEFLGNATILVR